jgi:CheY-like chemotaxis protein
MSEIRGGADMLRPFAHGRSVPERDIAAAMGDDDKAHAVGCNAYISKPYSPRQL